MKKDYKIKTLKLNKLIFSGKKGESLALKPYFKEVITLKSNKEILTLPVNESKIIFFNCDEKNNNCIELIQKIRQKDRKSIIVIMSKEKNINIFLEAIPLHLSGYLEKPLKKNEIEILLLNIVQDLVHLRNDEIIQLNNNHSFNTKELTLLDNEYNLIKLTKNEIKLMKILSHAKNTYVSSENIEHNIWEETSLEQNCNKRLKHLIYCLRKKLPQDNIINAYNLGYKLISH